MTSTHTIRLLSVVEADSITGPAKNLIELCARTGQGHIEYPGLPAMDSTIITFCRGRGAAMEHFSGAQSATPRPNQFMDAACEAGLRVDVIGEGFRYDPRIITRLRRIAEESAPAIIETHSVKSHFLMRLSGLWRRHPWIAFHHGYTTTDMKVRAYNQLDRWSLRAASHVITVSRAFEEHLIRIGIVPGKIQVVHNSIDADWGKNVSEGEALAVRASLGIANDERMVMTAGRLSHEKAHVDLVKAIAEMREMHADVKTRLVILGEGPERSRIEHLAAGLGIRDQMILTGQVNDVRPYYAAADLFVLPSLSEGSPNALLEAMAAALPIVATAVGGVPEIVSHNRSAWLVAPRNPSVMAGAIGKLLLDRQLAHDLGANARALAIKKYSSEARLRTLVEIYRQFMPGEPGSNKGDFADQVEMAAIHD